MAEFIRNLQEAWTAGGIFIWPIHLAAILSIAISIERFYWLFVKSSMNTEAFIRQLIPVIQRKDLQGAAQYCDSVEAPPARIAKSLIVRAMSKGSRDDIEATIESSLAREAHPVERRTPYLSMLANVATLLGLLGTISGLIRSFAAVADVDPNQKAEQLALGISEAMYATAYGLIVAITALFFFALLQGKTQSIIDDMKEVAFEVRSALPFHSSDKEEAA